LSHHHRTPMPLGSSPRPSGCLRRCLPWLAAAAILTLATGCATPQQSRYLSHLNSRMASGPAATREIALAFGLDEFRMNGDELVNAGSLGADDNGNLELVGVTGDAAGGGDAAPR
jgi:hypothetical protein